MHVSIFCALYLLLLLQVHRTDTATLGLPELHMTGQEAVDTWELTLPSYISTCVHFQVLQSDIACLYTRQQDVLVTETD